tara:strand:- start:5481 stop:5723 length:243 start_codon:yes stop_codon:yes gene_type:complete
VCIPLFCQVVHRDLLPITDILELKLGCGESFTLTGTVFFLEGDAEVTNAWVREVLSSSNKADVPAGTFNVLVFVLCAIRS